MSWWLTGEFSAWAGMKKAWRIAKPFGVRGGEEEDRTPDLRIANATLSQLSYPPIVEPNQGLSVKYPPFVGLACHPAVTLGESDGNHSSTQRPLAGNC
jgi:hypothetical protein